MATNFRNKQWFKNLSQDKKDEICKKFDIDEKTLKKAGRQTDDGRIVIDVIRIDHLLHTPKIWDICFKNLNIVIPDDCINTSDVFKMISNMEYIYSFMNRDIHYATYKSNLRNDLLTKQAHVNFMYWYNEKNNTSDKEYNKFCCFQMYMHCKCLLESDLNLIK